ncbi:hypothetical protein [Aquifex pyrophilus]
MSFHFLQRAKVAESQDVKASHGGSVPNEASEPILKSPEVSKRAYLPELRCELARLSWEAPSPFSELSIASSVNLERARCSTLQRNGASQVVSVPLRESEPLGLSVGNLKQASFIEFLNGGASLFPIAPFLISEPRPAPNEPFRVSNEVNQRAFPPELQPEIASFLDTAPEPLERACRREFLDARSEPEAISLDHLERSYEFSSPSLQASRIKPVPSTRSEPWLESSQKSLASLEVKAPQTSERAVALELQADRASLCSLKPLQRKASLFAGVPIGASEQKGLEFRSRKASLGL